MNGDGSIAPHLRLAEGVVMYFEYESSMSLKLVALLILATFGVFFGYKLWRGLMSQKFVIGGDDMPRTLITRYSYPLGYWVIAVFLR